jgi:hypothetical protein
MNALEAFHLGFALGQVGIPFHGMDILNDAGRGADPKGPLAELVRSDAAALRARNPETIDGVMRAEAFLLKNGLPAPPRPHTFEDFVRWEKGALETASTALDPGSPAAVALDVGGAIGDLRAALTLGCMAGTILDLVPEQARAKQEQDRAVRGIAGSATRIEVALRHPTLDPKGREHLQLILTLAHRASSGGPAKWAETNRELGQRARDVAPPFAQSRDAWIVLRVPRTESIGQMSAVLLTAFGGVLLERAVPNVAMALDRLAASADKHHVTIGTPTVVFPLDGRHGLAGAVLEEAQRRGWHFDRHLAPGNAHYLLDFEGPDAGPGLGADALTAKLREVGAEVQAATNGHELAEAMSALRHVVTLCVPRDGWWAVRPLSALSSLVYIAAGTGNAENVGEACELVRHALAQRPPEPLPDPAGVGRWLGEIARACAEAGAAGTASIVEKRAAAVARAG